MFTPLMRVVAEKGTNSASIDESSCSRTPNCLARTTIERPSGVSSASDESCAASARSCASTPGAGMNSTASRLPSVIVPVLSSRSTSMSPEASTARPERASTLRRTRRSIPAMPMHESSAPIVVGISATSRQISTVVETPLFAYSAKGCRVTTATRKIRVRPASRMLSAISLGVLRRAAPSTSEIMRSRNDLPGSWVTWTTSRSESSRVPPVTAERSPPDSRMTGADSPVMADSSTEPMPSITSPSAGIASPASTTTTSPRWSSGAGTCSVPPSSRRRVASVVVRIARSVSAWALPRPSAIASAKFAKITVNHSQTAMSPVNQSAWPLPLIRLMKNVAVVITEPTSTTNMTGFRSWIRGSSFLSESIVARVTISRVNSLASCRAISAPGRVRG